MTMIKGKPPTQPQEDNAPQFRENPEINAKIDAYIKANPKRWDYIQSLSQERMARTIVLQDVQKQERTTQRSVTPGQNQAPARAAQGI
jgi:hypothetical protein